MTLDGGLGPNGENAMGPYDLEAITALELNRYAVIL